MIFPYVLEQLQQEFAKLPGIGNKTAKRLAFSLLFRSEEDAQALANAIIQAKNKLHFCQKCYSLAEDDLCRICQNPLRQQQQICVVETPQDVYTIEATGIFQGIYHVLQGVIAPMNGVGPDDLKIQALEKRLQAEKIDELIIATNPTLEGEATAHFITSLCQDLVPKITRLATGLPTGSGIDFASQNTIIQAFEGRRGYGDNFS